MAFLSVKSLDVYYGSVQALRDISFELERGEVVCLIGANGAGKSTTLKAICGLLKPAHGEISFQGKRIDGLQTEKIVSLGVAYVPEGRRIFPGLTVLENLEIATTPWRKFGKPMSDDLDKVFNLFPVLRNRRNQLGWSLSGGEQQMLAIGRALMARPKLLLLDEPSLGLAPALVQNLFATIRKINEEGATVLLVEQNAYMALSISHRGHVVENGAIAISDTTASLAKNERVKMAYLGG